MLKQVLVIAISFFFLNATKAQPPKNAAAVYKQGVEFMSKEMYVDAMASFFKAVALYKNYDSAYVQMGMINVRYQSYDTAIKFYNKALDINPKNSQACMSLASTYRNYKNDESKALFYYLKAVAIDSTNKEALVGAAWCYNVKKEYDLAISYAVKALDVDNNYKPAYSEMGFAFNLSGKYAEAIIQFKKNIAISPNALPMYYCGLCYIQVKDKAGALSMYEALINLAPKMADALKKRIDAM